MSIENNKKRNLNAMQRIDLLLDEGSFFEIYSGVKSDCEDIVIKETHSYGDGVITGFGTIDKRKVAIYAQDFTVLGGTLGYLHGKKITELYRRAVDIRCPIIGICDSGGARIQEGVNALAGYGDMFVQQVRASGYIPQITIIAGPCAGGAAYSPGLSDFIFIIEKMGQMFMTGADVVKIAQGIETTNEELGGSEMLVQKNGTAHFCTIDEKDCYGLVKTLLKYIPHNNNDEENMYRFPLKSPNSKRTNPSEVIPQNSKHSYDIHKIINAIVDNNSFFEVHEKFAKNIVVGFSRIDGWLTGIIANQPSDEASIFGGSLTSDASIKAARFVRYCDSFNIPLLTLVDVPGYDPSPEESEKGIIKNGAKLIYAYAESTVPKIAVILRKAYSGAYISMCSKHLGADFVFALPKAEIAVMGEVGATEILYRKKGIWTGKDSPEESRERYKKEFMTPKMAQEKGYITEVIESDQIRDKITRGFEILRGKSIMPSVNKKHGNIPL